MLAFAHITTRTLGGSRPSAAAQASRNLVAAILTPADILLGLDVPTKNQALEEIARFVGARHELRGGMLRASLVERERIGSTARCYGVAIPHARVKGVSRPIAAFVRTKIPIPFDAPDGKPVGDMLVLVVPQHATEAHLQLLAQAAEMFSDNAFRGDLGACADAAEIHAAITHWER